MLEAVFFASAANIETEKDGTTRNGCADPPRADELLRRSIAVPPLDGRDRPPPRRRQPPPPLSLALSPSGSVFAAPRICAFIILILRGDCCIPQLRKVVARTAFRII
jgi:hypothetical protein